MTSIDTASYAFPAQARRLEHAEQYTARGEYLVTSSAVNLVLWNYVVRECERQVTHIRPRCRYIHINTLDSSIS